jgi:hypothetical protein
MHWKGKFLAGGYSYRMRIGSFHIGEGSEYNLVHYDII